MLYRQYLVLMALCLSPAYVQAVTWDASADALPSVIIPREHHAITAYAAQEFCEHLAQATGRRAAIIEERGEEDPAGPYVFIGPTMAAAAIGIHVAELPSEACVLRTHGDALYIAAKTEAGNPLSQSMTANGVLWGVYEVLERQLGVRWLWPGRLGTHVPKQARINVAPYDEVIAPALVQRHLRPSLGPHGFAVADPRLAFSPSQREHYAHSQSVFLRRHRMGRGEDNYFAEPSFGRGHAFSGWWEEYGQDHPEWFQLLPDGRRGPEDPERPHAVSMCVSNPEVAAKVVERWAAARTQYPGQTLHLGIGENDSSARCQCKPCRAWDGPMPRPERLPPGLERSYEPVQASSRYARFANRVYRLAAEIDPNVNVHFYAYLNYFWAPDPSVTLNENIIIGFVPWFRWAGWFPRTDAEHAWIKRQWDGWQRAGVTACYRPNWFLDGYTMPLVYMHQFADAFKHYADNGMHATDFDSLQGMWAAQGPNLYLLARIHVRPHMNTGDILGEYYAAFGPAAPLIQSYFKYWEDYAIENRANAAHSIQSRHGGRFRRYAKYARVAAELYPQEVFQPAFELLGTARGLCQPRSLYAKRVDYLREGLKHALLCVRTAEVMNHPGAPSAKRGRALARLGHYRRNVEHLGIANIDRAAIIETDSWQDMPGFQGDWGAALSTPPR